MAHSCHLRSQLGLSQKARSFCACVFLFFYAQYSPPQLQRPSHHQSHLCPLHAHERLAGSERCQLRKSSSFFLNMKQRITMTDCVILLSVYINLTSFVFITFSDDNCYTAKHNGHFTQQRTRKDYCLVIVLTPVSRKSQN